MNYKRKNIRLRIICLIMVILAVVNASAYVSGASVGTPEIIYGQYFDSTATNGVPEGITVMGGKTRVIFAGENNKTLQILGGVKTSVSFPVASDNAKYIVSFSVGTENFVDVSIALTSGSTQYNLLEIVDNVVRTIEGKVIGGITSNAVIKNGEMSGHMTDIAIAVNRESGVFSVYIDNKMCLRDWKLPFTAKSDGIMLTKAADENNNLYLDNVVAYTGEEPVQLLATRDVYNAEGHEFFSYTDDLGDYTFFNSNWIGYSTSSNTGSTMLSTANTTSFGYDYTSFYPKTQNEIVCEKFDYKNPNKGDRIIFKKKGSDDCYMDINCTISPGWKSQKTYKYLKLSGEFMCDFEGGGTANLFHIRDSKTGSSNVDEYLFQIDANNGLIVKGGQTKIDMAVKDNWFKVTAYLDLDNGSAVTLVNDKIVSENIALKAVFKQLNTVRISCGAGAFTGELQSRNIDVTGFDKKWKIEDGNVREINTHMFEYDKNMADDLTGKICFGYLVNSVFANGAKYKMSDKSVYENGELYISKEEFDKAYGTDITILGNNISYNGKTISVEDGAKLVPVKETAKNLLGHYIFDDEEGLLITSRNEIYFDKSTEIPYPMRPYSATYRYGTYRYIDVLSELQALYDYMLFDRPSKETLLEGFNKATNNGAQHPYIMATRSDFDRIKELAKTDSYMKALVEKLISQADIDIKNDPISYKFDDNIRTTSTAQVLERRMQEVGFAYQITGEQKYADYAWKCMEALNNFPDLNPVHPIDSGSYGTGIAIAYDWCYDGFSEEQRQNIRDNAKRLYLDVFPPGFYGRTSAKSRTANHLTINIVGLPSKWISNYNTWINSGGISMALAFMGDYPEICSDFLSNTIRSLEYTLKNLYPDGAWLESSHYWYEVARSMTFIYPSLDNIYGTDFGLGAFPGVEETAITAMSIRSMVGSYNYHDGSSEAMYASYPIGMFGKYFNQRGAIAARQATVSKSYDERMADDTVFVIDALCYDPTVKAEEIKELPRVKVSKGTELFAVHGDYTDYDAMFFASHAGPVSVYHGHNDNGDFVFDLNGVRWAMALGSEDYNSSLAEDQKYRRRTEGHNTLTINNTAGYNQILDQFNPLIRSEEGEGGAYAVYDLSDAYTDADRVHRGFYIDDNFRSLTVRDEIDLNKDNSEIYWFMHTTAEAYVMDERTVLLSSDNESVVLQFETNAEEASVSIMDAVPLPNSPNGTQNPNIGVRKVAIKLLGSGIINLSVRIDEFGEEIMAKPISEWTAPAKSEEVVENDDYGYDGYVYGFKRPAMGYIPVVNAANLPEFQIVPHDPEKTVEIIKSDSLDEPNLIRIYNKDKKRSKMYIIPYNAKRGVKELAYDEVEIKDFSVSAEPQIENSGKNMFDNDFATRWTTLNTGESAVFDLGSVQRIDGIATGFWQSEVRTYYFDLYTSVDGVTWTNLGEYTSSIGTEEFEVFSFASHEAQYIKLVGNGCSVNKNTNILEFRVLKKKASFEHVAADIKSHVFEITMTA